MPTRIADALGEMMILHQPFDVQIFDGEGIKLAHDLERRLVLKVGALRSNLPMAK